MNSRNLPTITVMCGLPGSGKSFYANMISDMSGAKIHSPDGLRAEMLGDVNRQDKNADIFTELHKRIKNDLISGKDVIYDATNINSKHRRAFVSELKNIPSIKKCVIIARPYESCIEINQNRERVVPCDVIQRMYKSWHTPYWFEGWDHITTYYPDQNYIGIYGNPADVPTKYKKFNQDTKYHSLTLGDHIQKTFDHINSDNQTIKNAALLHDSAKPFCKTFLNSNGTPSEIAHYYYHENVSAYNTLFYDIANVLDTSILVNLHMMPFAWENNNDHCEEIMRKYKAIWGDELYENIITLHQADRLAH